MADPSPSTTGPREPPESAAMGPMIRPFAYRRDPWWDVDGRSGRRRRRRRLATWAVLVTLAASLGVLAGEARGAVGPQVAPTLTSTTTTSS